MCLYQYGGPEVLVYRDLPRPVPGEGEVLIRVHATGVNPVDWKTRSGSPPAKWEEVRFPLILGWDVAGVVAELGQGVTGITVGEAVYGMIRFPEPGGAYAEYVAAPAAHVLPKPDTIRFEEAAALPLVSLTAWQALIEAGELARGQQVLIHGAAGGVGHVAVQLAKWRGAYVIGTARAQDADWLQALGLDLLIDHTTTRFEDVVHDLDLVLDTIGGQVQDRSWRVLRRGGRLVTLRSSAGLTEKMEKYGVWARRILVRQEPAHWARINELVTSGQLRPLVSAVWPLAEARQAHEQLEAGHTRGKVVLVCGPDLP